MREIMASEALLEAQDQLLERDSRVYLMGLGVPDPKGIFGTTTGLQAKYGSHRVMDMPTSENAMMGIGIGSALVGMRPILSHQRVDFFLLALDQLINNASKWRVMFGDQMHVPLVVRLIIGRGWGQGPQHSQSLHSLFAHIPGLKVVAPATPGDAKGLLIASVEDDDPVVFLEHRWIHSLYGEVEKEYYVSPLGKARVMVEGSDVTIVASSYMSIEAYRAAELLKKEGILAEVLDLRTLKPIDEEAILTSVKKTGRLLVVDGDWKFCGYAAEVCTLVMEGAFSSLRCAPKRITFADRICPTSWTLSNHFYPSYEDIVVAALQMMNQESRSREVMKALLERKMKGPCDVPCKTFTGPF